MPADCTFPLPTPTNPFRSREIWKCFRWMHETMSKHLTVHLFAFTSVRLTGLWGFSGLPRHYDDHANAVPVCVANGDDPSSTSPIEWWASHLGPGHQFAFAAHVSLCPPRLVPFWHLGLGRVHWWFHPWRGRVSSPGCIYYFIHKTRVRLVTQHRALILLG